MDIRKCCFLIVLFYSSISLANVERDSVFIDPRWNYWHVGAISENGDWVVAYQMYPNEYNKNKAFAVHTDTKKKIEITGVSQHHFTTTDFLIGKKGQETLEINLSNPKEYTSIGKLKQQDWINQEQLFVYINEKNRLEIKKYSKKGSEISIEKEGIGRYYINSTNNSLLYQKDGNFELYHLDLKTLEEKRLFEVNEQISSVNWNIQGNAITTILKNNNILYYDIETGISKIIEIPKEKTSIADISVNFFLNNDLYISYRVENGVVDPVDDYLDIWNGNDRELKYKGAKYKEEGKKEGDLKAFVYRQQMEKLLELPRNDKQDYLNMGIPNYLLVYDPLELQDYSRIFENKCYRLLQLDSLKEQKDLTTAFSLEFYLNRSPDGNCVIYPNGAYWEFYNIESEERFTILHKDEYSTPIWSSDSKNIYYQDESNLFVLDVKTQKSTQLTSFKGVNHITFQNKIQIQNGFYADINKPLFFSVRYPNDNKTSYLSLYEEKIIKLIDASSNRLNEKYLSNGVSKDGRTVVWTEENYNQPHILKVFRKGKVETLLEAELPIELYNWRKQKVIHYKDKFGVDLTGVLWYPKDFNPSKKYPMVTFIYDLLQGNDRSLFDIPIFYAQHGFSRALLSEQGYFVFQADTYVSEEGPGVSAVECIKKGIESITTLEPTIERQKIGLIGFSFGGYKTSFILGNSKLFATGISGGGAHDLINFNYEYNYLRKMPNWLMLENEQYGMKESFGDNPEKYYKNSPIHFAQNYPAPILLWTGMQDDNVHWENTRHMYIALQRYKKPVVALFYKNEGHGLWENRKDLTLRVLDWFDYYLKENKEVEWISTGIDYTKY